MGDAFALAGLSQNSKIELAKTLLAVKSIASEADYEAVRTILVRPEHAAAVDQAVRGLSKGDEFALMCQLMGTATHLVPLEQRPIIKGRFQVPDFLARFQPGCTPNGKPRSDHGGYRCLVEVKSTSQDEYRISGKKLRHLRAFADQFGLPLVFAVRFLRYDAAAWWMIVEDDRAKTAVTVTVNALTSGIRSAVWDDYMFMMMPNICFRAVFDTLPGGEVTGVTHEQYGREREFHVVTFIRDPNSGEAVVTKAVRFKGQDALFVSAFCEVFSPEEVVVNQEGATTVVVLRPIVDCCSIADLIYGINRLPKDSKGRVLFDPSRILAGAETNRGMATRSLVEKAADVLTGAVVGLVTFGDQLEAWHRTGGRG